MGSCNIITNDLVNNIGTSPDGASGLVNCNTQTSSNFRTYTPYTGTVAQFADVGGSTQGSATGFISNLDGSCCYIINSASAPDNIKCNDFSFNDSTLDISVNLERVRATHTIDNSNSIYDGSLVSICGVPSRSLGATAASESTPYGGLQSQNIQAQASHMSGVKGLILLVIGGLLSTLVYVIFVLGPFMFWTKFAPNTIITNSNACYNGRTIMDRFFGYNSDNVPYNWKKYQECRPPKEKPLVLDSCKGQDNTDYLSSKVASLKTSGDLWSKVEYLLRGFPYNLIDENVEKIMLKYKGLPLLGGAIVLCYSLFELTRNFNPEISDVLKFILSGGIGGVMGIIILLISLFHLKTIGNHGYVRSAIVAFITFIGLAISSFIGKADNLAKGIAGAITSLLVFFTIWNLASKKTSTDKNFSLMSALYKLFYYTRRAFVTGYINSTKRSCKVANKWLEFFGKLPIPNWIWVVLGGGLIPFVLLIISFAILILGAINGFTGFFDFVDVKKLKEMDTALSGGSNSNNNSDNKVGGLSGNALGNKVKEYTNKKISQIKDNPQPVIALILLIIPIVVGLIIKDSVQLGTTLLLLITPAVVSLFYGIINVITFALTYHIMPLLYPKIFVQTISCNINTLIILFGIGIISTMWTLRNKDGINFVPVEALSWMTATFVIITLYKIFVK